MNWTTEKPTKEGYYWAKKNNINSGFYKPSLIYADEETFDKRFSYMSCQLMGTDCPGELSEFDLFYGPIEVPKEPIL